jgi:hypothetical protein
MSSRGRCSQFNGERVDVGEDRGGFIPQFGEQLARVAVLSGLTAFRAIARGGQVPILSLDSFGRCKPPFLGPGRGSVAIPPIPPPIVTTVEGGDQAGEIVSPDRLVVVGVELEAIGA